MARIIVKDNASISTRKMFVKATDDNHIKALACLRNANGYIEYTVGNMSSNNDYSSFDTYVGKIQKVEKNYVILVGGKRVKLDKITNFNL